MKPTKEEVKQHYIMGILDYCLICEKPLSGSWTDYNGQIKCNICGTTYQINGSHLREEYLKEMGLDKKDIAKRYCDCFELIPLLRDYWHETGEQIPFGTFFGSSSRRNSQRTRFYSWLYDNANKYQEEYKDDFNWSALKAWKEEGSDTV